MVEYSFHLHRHPAPCTFQLVAFPARYISSSVHPPTPYTSSSAYLPAPCLCLLRVPACFIPFTCRLCSVYLPNPCTCRALSTFLSSFVRCEFAVKLFPVTPFSCDLSCQALFSFCCALYFSHCITKLFSRSTSNLTVSYTLCYVHHSVHVRTI